MSNLIQKFAAILNTGRGFQFRSPLMGGMVKVNVIVWDYLDKDFTFTISLPDGDWGTMDDPMEVLEVVKSLM